MADETLLIVQVIVTALSVLGSTVWLDRKIAASGEDLKSDITSQKNELKADITAMGNNSTTAHKQINAKLDALTVNVTTLTERVSCIDDKLDAIQRRV